MSCKILFGLAVTLVVAFLDTGCATVIKGRNQTIPIASAPAGAKVKVDGIPWGTTPTSVQLDRKHSHMITLELADYEVENVSIINSMGWAVAGNAIAGGLIGWGVDASTGAQYNLHPDTVNVTLRPKTKLATPTPTPTKNVAEELGKLDELHAAGKLADDEYGSMRRAVLAKADTGTAVAPAPIVEAAKP